MEPAIRETCPELLARDDVVILDFVRDVGALYRSADVFVFPTLEEGSPLVTYEACGSGLAVVTSPMGTGGVVRDKQEGIVLDPYDEAGWVQAFRSLAEDIDRRRAMGMAARERAQSFQWSTVALQRRSLILERLRGPCKQAVE
jgi:glycosyltransferase involved in cell wall biosynthesis